MNGNRSLTFRIALALVLAALLTTLAPVRAAEASGCGKDGKTFVVSVKGDFP